MRFESEREYQVGLHQHLLGRISEDSLRVEREYGAGDSRIDLVVEDKYGIELKMNPGDAGDLKPIREQVATIQEKFDGGVLVLCGQVREDYLRKLRQEFREVRQPEDELVIDVIAVTTPVVE